MESPGKNQGTTFRVSLGLLRKRAAVVTDGAISRARSSKKLRLLLVDDHDDTRGLLSRLLNKCGHEVITADSVQNALSVLDRAKFDAVISDVGLPGTSGYELIREAKQRQPLKGVALSGLGMDEDLRRSRDAGFDYHLTKPINFQDLRTILEKMFD